MTRNISEYSERIKYIIKKVLFNSFSSFFIITLLLISYCHLKFLNDFYEVIINISRVISIIIIVLYLFRLRASDLVKCIVIYIAFLFLSTIIGENSTLKQLYTTYHKILAMVLYIDWGLNVDKKRIINSLFYSLFTIITINFITIIVYPNGMYKTVFNNNETYPQNWFLKYKNMHIIMYMPALLVSYIRIKYNNKIDIMSILLFIMITFSVYYCLSVTSIVAYTLFLMYIVMYKKINNLKCMNARNYFALFMAIFVFIVIFRCQELFSWFIVDILGKSLTLTHRTEIWDKVIMYIREKMIFGYGMETATYIGKKLGDPRFSHAHNTILDILYKGGTLTLIPYITMLVLTVEELFKNRKKEMVKFASVILLCIFIMINFEAREEAIGFYIVFIICYYIDEIIEDTKTTNSCNKEIAK